jgi:DNA topoisomerase-1
VLAGRFGPYVKWGKVNATIPKSKSPETITLDEAVELIADREGRPAKPARKTGPAKKAAAKPAAPKKAPAKAAAPKPRAAKGRGAA